MEDPPAHAYYIQYSGQNNTLAWHVKFSFTSVYGFLEPSRPGGGTRAASHDLGERGREAERKRERVSFARIGSSQCQRLHTRLGTWLLKKTISSKAFKSKKKPSLQGLILSLESSGSSLATKQTHNMNCRLAKFFNVLIKANNLLDK